jgi:hypothetical protein
MTGKFGTGEVLLAAVHKSPGHAWCDAEIEFLSFRHKSLLTRDLNAKHPILNSVFSKPSGENEQDLLDIRV